MSKVVAILERVTKSFGEGDAAFVALREFDFSVQEGELVIISGPSGSGKTTALSILGCVLRATSGRVILQDEDITHLPEHELAKRRLTTVGFVFQAHNLVSSLTVLDNVAILARMRSRSRSEARATSRALLERVGLGGKLAALPASLSGGERQRVAVARAVVCAPPLLLADEPTASLDASSGLNVTSLLRNLALERGLGVVVVTHDPRIMHLADRRIHIEDGRIAAPERSLG